MLNRSGFYSWLQKIKFLETKPVLGIRDVSVRIRIRGSVPLTNGSGSGSNSRSDFHISSAQQLYEKREGSWSGSIPLTNGSATGKPKNMRILRIRIPTLNQTVKLKWTRSRQCGWHVTHHRNFLSFEKLHGVVTGLNEILVLRTAEPTYTWTDKDRVIQNGPATYPDK